MKTTYLQAKELYKAGSINEAWEVAQKDEGINEGVTKEQWIKFMDSKTK